jgi:CHAD domain-containing protein
MSEELAFTVASPSARRRAWAVLSEAALRLDPLPITRRRGVFLDAQDGRLFASGRYLIRYHSAGWELQRLGRVPLRSSSSAWTSPRRGGLAGELAEAVGNSVLAPWLGFTRVERRYRLVPKNGGSFNVRLESWTFSAPGSCHKVRSRPLLILCRGRAAEEQFARLVDRLAVDARLARCDRRPLELGLGLLDLALPGAPTPDHLVVRAADAVGKAAVKVVSQQAYRMKANTFGAAEDLDLEFVHDLRVATRRARFALRLFGPYLGVPKAESIREELRWIAGLLGEVRDLDVFLESFASFAEQAQAAESAATHIRSALQRRRSVGQDALSEALDSRRYQRLVQRLTKLSAKRDSGLENLQIAAAAQQHIRKAAKKALKWRHCGEFTPEALHRLRIAFKRLRYTTEFFLPLYGDAAKHAIRCFVRFQDCLGAYQDSVVGERLLQPLAADPSGEPEHLLALGALLQVQRDRRSHQYDLFLELWKELPQVIRDFRKQLKSPLK